MTTTIRVESYAGVRAVLSDPGFVVPALPEAPDGAASTPSLAWLREHATRFSTGGDHRRRRAFASALLSGLAPSDLRREAEARARSAGPDQAPHVPVAVLSASLGIPEADVPEAVAAVRDVAAAYFPGTEEGREDRADAGVRTLVRLLPDSATEEAAQRVCLLVQTCDATAGLVRAALDRDGDHDDAWGLLTEALRLSPPAPVMKRTALGDTEIDGVPVPEGALVLLDLAAANRDPDVYKDPDRFAPERYAGDDGGPGEPPPLSFGAGERPCPGSDHALAMATGVLHAQAR
ncbi:cytochrome P450 [Nocardiopsis sp. RSe5-2]|uniref:Cytochrome P450 n=1 Tax=Nocardiopsis endophytica TaxID=3018445 RepID=A0ABT4U6Q2_9ACTN|nr:cytochrome P450 [Nocardiopsis endophytica]MDA2812391.1 cytochrome P450 [Nocardiopsis endophytica]